MKISSTDKRKLQRKLETIGYVPSSSIIFSNVQRHQRRSAGFQHEKYARRTQAQEKHREYFAQLQRERYAEKRGDIQRKKKKSEIQAATNDKLKCNALCESLLKSQQNSLLLMPSKQRFLQCITHNC